MTTGTISREAAQEVARQEEQGRQQRDEPLSEADRKLAAMFAGNRPDLVPDLDAIRRAGL